MQRAPRRQGVREEVRGRAGQERPDGVRAAALGGRVRAAPARAGPGPDAERGRIVSLGLEYGLMTPYTSILALESEAGVFRDGHSAQALDAARRGAGGAGSAERAPARGDAQRVAGFRDVRLQSIRSRVGGERTGTASQTDQVESKRQVPPRAGGCGPSSKTPGHRAGALQADEPAADGSCARADRTADRAPGRRPPRAEARCFRSASQPAWSDRRRARRTRRKGQRSGWARLAEPVDKDEQSERPAEEDGERPGRTAATTTPALVPVVMTCSDAAARPLAQRVLLWRRRLATAKSSPELIDRYEAARRACELGNWRAERTFLELLEQTNRQRGRRGRAAGSLQGAPRGGEIPRQADPAPLGRPAHGRRRGTRSVRFGGELGQGRPGAQRDRAIDKRIAEAARGHRARRPRIRTVASVWWSCWSKPGTRTRRSRSGGDCATRG